MSRVLPIILMMIFDTVLLAGNLVKEDSTRLMPEPRHAREAMLITQLLEHHHYLKMKFSDSLSSAILDAYINTLDPGKSYFLAGDIQSF